MSKPFTVISAIFFIGVGLTHALRLYTGAITVTAFHYTIPLWVSWPAVVISFFLAFMLLSESRR